MVRIFLFVGMMLLVVQACMYGSVRAQSAKAILATVSGQVDDTNGNPITGAAVKLDGPAHLRTVTDASGHFVFIDVPPRNVPCERYRQSARKRDPKRYRGLR